VKCDGTDEEEVKSAVETIVNKFGRIDILLNNAGIAVRGGVDTLSEEDWNKSMDTNVKGIYLMSKYIIPVMKKQNYGKVVNVSSINALLADKNDVFIRHSYNASKAAVLGLSRGMAASYAQFGITVNSVCPGLFESEMTEDTLFKSQEFLAKYNLLCPTSRPAKKGELNGTILYFSSNASSYVTGQHIVVDGGLS
ncbi:SDR family oxidoreductase, partial [Clostridium perfringens]|nr:SDR family oxidoreductase [Clostridium perfringens]